MIKFKSIAVPKIHFSGTSTSIKIIKTASNKNLITRPLHNEVLLINHGKPKSHPNTVISSSLNQLLFRVHQFDTVHPNTVL
jgi:hypothetical protein